MGFASSAEDFIDFQGFQCSLVIYDIDEKYFLLKDNEDVNFKLINETSKPYK